MKKTALLFSGQGSQYVGMGKNLYEKFPEVRSAFDQAGAILGFDLAKLCWEGNPAELTRTENAQPAILTLSKAMFDLYLKDFKVAPLCAAGHSLGEISALSCAGAIEFTDALKIVRQRGLLMQEANDLADGAMAAINGISPTLVQMECAKINGPTQVLVISNYNSPDQVVISGHRTAVTEVGNILKGKGGKIIPLNVSAAFHSPLMFPVAERFQTELQKYQYHPLKWPVLSNVTGLPYPDSNAIVAMLTQQLTLPVRWQESIAYLQKNGIEIAVEIGPQSVLCNLMKTNNPTVKAFAYDKAEDLPELQKILSDPIRAADETCGFRHNVITKSIQIAVCTRNRNWDDAEYQRGVVEPYRRIQQLQEKLEKEAKEPNFEQMKEALEMLRSVFITKKVPLPEQRERYLELFEVTGTLDLFPDFAIPDESLSID